MYLFTLMGAMLKNDDEIFSILLLYMRTTVAYISVPHPHPSRVRLGFEVKSVVMMC